MNTTLQQRIFPDENAPIHRKKSVAATVRSSKGTVLGQKKKRPGGVGARKALNDITNKSAGVIHRKAASSSKNKQIASCGSAKCETNIIAAGEMFLHDHSKCIKEQRSLWDDHFSADNLLLHHDSSCIKDKHLRYDIAMDGKNNFTCDEPEEIPSPKLTSYMKSLSTPWRSPIRHGSMMMIMPSTPLAWRFDSAEFTLKEDYDDDLF